MYQNDNGEFMSKKEIEEESKKNPDAFKELIRKSR
jgi:uncharacterized protein YneF (UPF0154 family)